MGQDTIDATRARVHRAKRAFTTRHCDLTTAAVLVDRAPRAGDLVLARVAELGQHRRLESPAGRRQTLFVDDEIVVAYGARYAPDQFSAVVPDDLSTCSLVAGGGVAARVVAAHAAMDDATTLEPVGLLADEHGDVLRLADGLDPLLALRDRTAPRPVTVVVAGAAMNSGKTTAAAALARGLTRQGLRVGAAKVTGTGSGGDLWLLADSGASPVLDFTSMGMATTSGAAHGAVLACFASLTNVLAGAGCDVAIIEVADGVLQRESAELLAHPVVRERADGVVLATPDALSAVAGLDVLARMGLPVVAVSGLVSASPLASAEAELATGRDVWTIERLESSDALAIVGGARSHAGVADPSAVAS